MAKILGSRRKCVKTGLTTEKYVASRRYFNGKRRPRRCWAYRRKLWWSLKAPFLILCGRRNNGGDGAALQFYGRKEQKFVLFWLKKLKIQKMMQNKFWDFTKSFKKTRASFWDCRKINMGNQKINPNWIKFNEFQECTNRTVEKFWAKQILRNEDPNILIDVIVWHRWLSLLQASAGWSYMSYTRL